MFDLKPKYITHKLLDFRKKVDYLITVDIDQTLIENDILWAQIYNKRCLAETPHRPVPLHEVSLAWDHFKDICSVCFDECDASEEILVSHQADETAREVLSRLKNDGLFGKSIGFHAVTARPEKTVSASIKWFTLHELAPLFQAVTFSANKRPVLEELGALAHVDDSYKIYQQLTHPTPSFVHPIFIDTKMTRNIYIPERVYNWNEVENKIKKIISEKIVA